MCSVSELLKLLFTYLFLAVLSLRCCAGPFSSCSEQGLLSSSNVQTSHRSSFSPCRARVLGTWASVLRAHVLSSLSAQALELRLSSCGTRVQLFLGMWDLPGSGLEPVSPALAGGFFTSEPPGKPQALTFFFYQMSIIFQTVQISTLCHHTNLNLNIRFLSVLTLCLYIFVALKYKYS